MQSSDPLNRQGDAVQHRQTRREFLRSANATLFGVLGIGGTAGVCGCRSYARAEPINVGLLHSQTGTMAMSESALRDSELYAIEEINAVGGVVGRPIRPIVKDPKSRSEDLFPLRAGELLANDQACAVFGCWTSSSRKAVLPVLEELGGLLFYPVPYEGNECSPNVVYTGTVPNQQVLPAVDWLRSLAGGSRRRFFLLGSDYVFPWTLSPVVRHHIAATFPDTEIVRELYVPLAERDFDSVVRDIKASEADVVLNMVNGDDNIYFFNELHRQGITAERLPVLSTSVGENELRGLLPEAVEGHLAAFNYCQSVDRPQNRDFVSGFQTEHGLDRVTSDAMEAAYVSVYLWKTAVELAGETNPMSVRDALRKPIEIDAPGGAVSVDPRNQHLHKRCRIGKIRADRQFDIVYEAPRAIRPEPFPQNAFPGWRCDWTDSGLVQGPLVDVRKLANR